MGVLPGDGWTGCIFRSPSIHSPELVDPGARRSLPKFAARCSAGGQHSLPGPGGVYLGALSRTCPGFPELYNTETGHSAHLVHAGSVLGWAHLVHIDVNTSQSQPLPISQAHKSRYSPGWKVLSALPQMGARKLVAL